MSMEKKGWLVDSSWSGVAMFAGVAIVVAAFNHTDWIIQHRHWFLLSLVGVVILIGIVRMSQDKKMTAKEIMNKYEKVTEEDDDEYDVGKIKSNILSSIAMVIVSFILLTILILIGLSFSRTKEIEKELLLQSKTEMQMNHLQRK